MLHFLMGLSKRFLLFAVFLHDCEVSDDIPLLAFVPVGVASEFLVHLFFLLPFHPPLVLDEGDAQNFDDNWDVAQGLHKPKSVRIRDVHLENTSNHAHLVSECHEDVRLVEVFLEVLHEHVLELREHCVKQVNH